MTAPPQPDYDAIVVGAGHNGLVTAAYLARAGMRTVLLEARDAVGGTAGSECFAGATVNVCNCDHLTFRTTPVTEELGLDRFGLRYLDVDPAMVAMAWSGGPAWAQWHDVEQTVAALADAYPDEIGGYRRYLHAARPAVDLILGAATEPPTAAGLTRLAVRRRLAGVPTIVRWSRRSAAAVLRSYFRSDAVLAAGLMSGPLVWGLSPEQPGTGLGALTYALRHAARLGRPAGGSGALPVSLLAAYKHFGGEVRTKAEVVAITCESGGVRAVTLADDTELVASTVVVACDPRRAFVEWLRHQPAAATRMIDRWRHRTHAEGYESKVDAVVREVPVVRGAGDRPATTLCLVPTVADMDRAARLLPAGEVLDRPAMFVNVPSVLDPSLAPAGRHVFSLEVLFTPYRRPGGWRDSPEPERWLDVLAERCEPGFRESIVEWRAMTPDVYEREFRLPSGHAASFSGGPLAAFRTRDPELTRYATAIPGLYVTGAATFPGAGIWGASGRNCATVVLADRG
jgi:phytoene dehydrogenase-like protein